MDHEEHGATPLLGINGVVMKCHGSSSERGIKNSIIATQKTVEGKLIDGIADRLSRHSDIFDEDIAISEKKNRLKQILQLLVNTFPKRL